MYFLCHYLRFVLMKWVQRTAMSCLACLILFLSSLVTNLTSVSIIGSVKLSFLLKSIRYRNICNLWFSIYVRMCKTFLHTCLPNTYSLTCPLQWCLFKKKLSYNFLNLPVAPLPLPVVAPMPILIKQFGGKFYLLKAFFYLIILDLVAHLLIGR